MDVTFRESEPFYGEQTDLSLLFKDLDHPAVGPEGENTGGGSDIGTDASEQQHQQPLIGVIPVVMQNTGAVREQHSTEAREQQQERWCNPPRVYGRRQEVDEQRNEGHQNPIQGEQGEQQANDSGSSGESQAEGGSVSSEGTVDLPIVLRKRTRATAGRPPQRYVFETHDIGNYVSYEALSPSYRAFVASLQLVSIPTDWRVARQDPKWCAAMREELEALRKNRT
jgi:hypothetical protein